MASDDSKKEVNNIDDAGYHLMFDDVTMSSAQSAIEWIMETNLTTDKKHDELNLVICSPGGELPACFALIDVMRGSAIPIKTTGLGMIASCCLLYTSPSPRDRTRSRMPSSA